MTMLATSNLTLVGSGPVILFEKMETLAADSHIPTPGVCRSHIPININIHSISSHAEAETLVQHAQQSTLDMDR